MTPRDCSTPSDPEVGCTVIIPTYNAAHLLGRQLAALSAQLDPPAFEVVVADNGSTDDLRALIDEWLPRIPLLRVVNASHRRGVSVARNVGIEAARSDSILICDADDEVSSGWVSAYHRALEISSFAGGPIDTRRLSGRAVDWGPLPTRTTDLPEGWQGVRYPIGCNLALRRDLWSQVGGFAEDYPPGGEEIDFALRARSLGVEASFVPEALVHYRVRDDLRGLLRQQYNSGRGTATLAAIWGGGPARTLLRQFHHEVVLLSRWPWRGTNAARRSWLLTAAYELGKLVEARRLGVPPP